MKKVISIILCVLIAILFAGCNKKEKSILDSLDESRIKTIESIKKISDYQDLNIYSMEVMFDYDLDNLTPVTINDTQQMMEAVFQEAAPGITIDYTAPNYGGCSVFTLQDEDGQYRFGRNYDFKYDASAMIVYAHPKDGYASVAHSALNNVNANDALSSDITKLSCLTQVFTCIDGINEKGVGIGVLTLDSDPVNQDNGKPTLATTILIRLVLDKADSTARAIELLEDYDMYAISGRDYHFYITDSSGDSRIVEFDCESAERKMVVTPTNIATNFYILYKDRVLPNQRNGIYGHGRERYDAIEEVFNNNNNIGGNDVAWQALKAASQVPNPDSVTSNTQWSIVYNLNTLEYEFVLHRNWDDVYSFKLNK